MRMIIVAPVHICVQSAHYTRAQSYNIIVIGCFVCGTAPKEAPVQALITQQPVMIMIIIIIIIISYTYVWLL